MMLRFLNVIFFRLAVQGAMYSIFTERMVEFTSLCLNRGLSKLILFLAIVCVAASYATRGNLGVL